MLRTAGPIGQLTDGQTDRQTGWQQSVRMPSVASGAAIRRKRHAALAAAQDKWKNLVSNPDKLPSRAQCTARGAGPHRWAGRQAEKGLTLQAAGGLQGLQLGLKLMR